MTRFRLNAASGNLAKTRFSIPLEWHVEIANLYVPFVALSESDTDGKRTR